MPQHKPKLDQISRSEPESSYSTGYQEDVIILPPEQEQAVQIESKRSFVFSFMLRIAGLCIGSAAALFFLSHYVPGDLATLQNLSPVSSTLWLLIGIAILTFGRIYFFSVKDQNLSIEELRSQSSKVFTKPVLSYLGWTFTFFVFAALGPSWFRWVAAWFIFNAGTTLKFQKSGFMRLNSWPAGAARFQTFKFRR